MSRYHILQNLIGGGGQIPEGNQQAVDSALFAAQKAAAETLLKHFHVSPNGISKIKAAKTTLDSLYGGTLGIPCGSGWATDNFDAFEDAAARPGARG